MQALLTAILITTLAGFTTTKSFSAEKSDNKLSLFSQFKNSFDSAYNEKVNAAHFKGALVDAVLVSRKITIYYAENSSFPASVADINHSGFMGQEAVAVQLGENGAFQIQLIEIFGEDKFVAMKPVLEHNEISTWTCHSNVTAAILEGTFCTPFEQ